MSYTNNVQCAEPAAARSPSNYKPDICSVLLDLVIIVADNVLHSGLNLLIIDIPIPRYSVLRIGRQLLHRHRHGTHCVMASQDPRYRVLW